MPQTHQELPREDIQLHLRAGHAKHHVALHLTFAIPEGTKRQLLHMIFLNTGKGRLHAQGRTRYKLHWKNYSWYTKYKVAFPLQLVQPAFPSVNQEKMALSFMIFLCWMPSLQPLAEMACDNNTED